MIPHSLHLANATVRRSQRLQRVCTTLTLTLLALLAGTQLSFGQISNNLIVAGSRRLHVSATLPAATAGVSYNGLISATDGTAPYRFRQRGLPAELTLSEKTGSISGTPQTDGQFPLQVYVKDAVGDSRLVFLSLTINKEKQSIGISVSPNSVNVGSGATAQFNAKITNTSNTAAIWSVTKGSVSTGGLFTAPVVTTDTSVVVTATSVADPNKSASGTITVAAIPASTVALEVLFPPTHKRQPYYNEQSYLINNPIVSGANLRVEWSAIDQGPGASPQYDWSEMDTAVQTWIAGGKNVNLIVWATSDGPGNTTTPQYIFDNLGQDNYTMCDGQQMPNYFSPAFQIPYQKFMAAVVHHYGSNPGIGYIRFGLGRGGETNPARGLGREQQCTNSFENKWGWTEKAWINYLNSMLNYEASLRSPKQLMVGLVGTNLLKNAPSAAAATAVAAHIGFGSRGLNALDMANYPNCTSDWCDLFEQYLGQGVPLELQTIAGSDPSGVGQTGSLVSLIPFAINHHATVLEIYYCDWLLAFDPTYPGHNQYGPAYAQVLTQAAHAPTR